MTRFDGHNAWLTTRPSDQQPKSRRTRPPKPDRPGGPVIAASMPVGGAPLPRAAKPPRPVRRKRTLHDVHLGKDGTPLLLDGHTPADPPAWVTLLGLPVPPAYRPKYDPRDPASYPHFNDQFEITRRHFLFSRRYQLIHAPITAGQVIGSILMLLLTLGMIAGFIAFVIAAVSVFITVVMGALALSFLVFCIKAIVY